MRETRAIAPKDQFFAAPMRRQRLRAIANYTPCGKVWCLSLLRLSQQFLHTCKPRAGLSIPTPALTLFGLTHLFSIAQEWSWQTHRLLLFAPRGPGAHRGKTGAPSASVFPTVFTYAQVAELADAPDLGSGGVTRGGSSPSLRTKSKNTSKEAKGRDLRVSGPSSFATMLRRSSS